MKTFTKKENEVLLFLFKNSNIEYNANSLSKELDLTPRGSLKILKNLEKENIVSGIIKGKAKFYKLNLNDRLTNKYLEVLLIQESREKVTRWIIEFKELNSLLEVVMIFGSIVRDSKKANDIDLLLVIKSKNLKKVKEYVKNKNRILLKPIHPVLQSEKDFIQNIRKSDQVILNILRTGYILNGQDKVLEMIKNVTNI